MPVTLSPATREMVRLRMLLMGATGAGKTCTGLRFATAIARRYGGRIGVIDTQHKQSRDYAGTQWAPLGFYPFDLEQGNPEGYVNALGIFAKDKDGPPFSVVLIDGLADAWQGKGGVLELAGDKAEFSDWGPAKKPNVRLIEAIQKAPFHVIATCLSDTQYLIRMEDGKIKKGDGISVVGTKPIQDKKVIPRFNVQCSLDEYHRLTVIRTSFSPYDRLIVEKPGEDFMEPLLNWVDSGKEPEGFTAEVRAASLDQIREYYELQAGLGNPREVVIPAFYKKYGSKPEDCTEEFLEERLKELREKRPSQRLGTAGVAGISSPTPSRVAPKSQSTGTSKLESEFEQVINDKGKVGVSNERKDESAKQPGNGSPT